MLGAKPKWSDSRCGHVHKIQTFSNSGCHMVYQSSTNYDLCLVQIRLSQLQCGYVGWSSPQTRFAVIRSVALVRTRDGTHCDCLGLLKSYVCCNCQSPRFRILLEAPTKGQMNTHVFDAVYKKSSERHSRPSLQPKVLITCGCFPLFYCSPTRPCPSPHSFLTTRKQTN